MRIIVVIDVDEQAETFPVRSVTVNGALLDPDVMTERSWDITDNPEENSDTALNGFQLVLVESII